MIVNGKKMRAARLAAGKTLTDAAHIAGMSDASISRIETKGGNLNRHICRALAKAYNVHVGSMEAPNIQSASQ